MVLVTLLVVGHSQDIHLEMPMISCDEFLEECYAVCMAGGLDLAARRGLNGSGSCLDLVL